MCAGVFVRWASRHGLTRGASRFKHRESRRSGQNHQGLANALIDGESEEVVGGSAVACRERLGGLLKFYYREAP
jgi:hypothetical protein